MASSRYQRGSLEPRKTKEGKCWFLRFRQRTGEATSRPRIRIGLVSDYPTKTAARKAANKLCKEFNLDAVPQPRLPLPAQVVTFQDVISRYEEEEMPKRYSTAKGYRSYLHFRIAPRWGATPLKEIKPVDVRAWLLALPLAGRTRGHIRDLMRILFDFAMLWELVPYQANPISTFRLEGSTKRRARPRSLTIEEFHLLLAHIPSEPYRTMVLTAAMLGLRRSEVLALQWQDVDFDKLVIRICRGIVDGNPDVPKTEASAAGLPLHPFLAARLLEQKQRSEFTEVDDWIFASPHKAGEVPYSGIHIQESIIAPAGVAAGLGKGIGWHTFRHSYRSWMGAVGTNIEMQRTLMRHGSIATTMNVYGDTFSEHLREANEKAIGRLVQ